jgi:hypothetical protein
MPVQDVRVSTVSAKGEIKSDVLQRPAAVDAVRWGATLLAQSGLEESRKVAGR